ncbi:exostosin-3 [Amyelois transitella]|uniref:exostosin-3 n=1 Tax=Amyelois transitella TaxID=680683 RepID=UPI00298FC9A9|nr:exostosin-3 [Amyelois transitella]
MLPFWQRTGSNHVLVNLDQNGFAEDTGDAILAQTTFTRNSFRPGYDIVTPPVLGPLNVELWTRIPPIAPPKRKYLFSFQGFSATKSSLLETLKQYFYNMRTEVKYDKIYVEFNCEYVDQLFERTIRDWALCYTRETRRKLLRKSTFVVIFAPINTTYDSTFSFQTRLYEALESGAIPVVLGGDRIRLPFEEVLDWRKAVISLSIVRVKELLFLLKTMTLEDILAFRSQGRMLLERYFGSMQTVLDTLLAVIRNRLSIPPRPVASLSTGEYDYYPSNKTNRVKAFPSRNFKRNFTVGLLNGYEQWNVWGDPFALYPQLPWDPMMTPEPRFVDEAVAKRFHRSCKSLAGDRPVEQFTVIILTYNRTKMLAKVLNALSNLRFLNKIIVVCNGPAKPSTIDWPTSGPPIVRVHGSGNSLNNRFLPYHLIETEAVFCLDDDDAPKRDEIYFAFKVWREHRDQIVGFFGRNYEWDEKGNAFVYSTLYKIERNIENTIQCEISMVLTGAAFIHRYFLWAYWRVLPQAVRSFVDDHMNCEDIAMNFLVSHITRKPPVKVSTNLSSKPDSIKNAYDKLSNDKFHYRDRDKCLQFFTKVMGYNPLLTTHYRVKSFAKKPLYKQI